MHSNTTPLPDFTPALYDSDSDPLYASSDFELGWCWSAPWDLPAARCAERIVETSGFAVEAA